VVDGNLTTHIVWTEVDAGAETARAYYATVTHDNETTQPILIATFNKTQLSIPRTRVAFNPITAVLHVAWIESGKLPEGGLISSVSYVKLGLITKNITQVLVATYNRQLEGLSVTSGPGGNSYIVWEEDQPGASNSIYVAQVSQNGQIAFVKQLPPPNSLGSKFDFVLSADSQDNLYVVWYQRNVPSYGESASRTLTSIAYLKMDRDGSVSQSRSELVEGPLLAVTVSTTGDLYAISQQGIVRVTEPIGYWNNAPILLSLVAATAVGGAVLTEEIRYKAVLSIASAYRSLRRERNVRTSDTVMRTLCRKPGLTVTELKRLMPNENPTMLKLAMLEKEGYVSSVRIGFRRKFYGSEQLVSPGNSASMGFESIPMRILHEIELNPGTWEARLAQTLGLSQQIVHYHLKKMLSAGIINAESQGKRKHYRLCSTPRREQNALFDELPQ